MKTLARAWTWTKEHALLLVAAIALLLGGATAWLLHRRKVGSIRDALAVEAAARKVEGLDARRKALSEREGDVSWEIEAIEREREQTIRDAVERARGVGDRTDAELVSEWNDLYRGGRS